MDEKIKLVYIDSKIRLEADKKYNNLEVYEHVALAMLRQMNKTKKGKENLNRIATVLTCWKLDDER